uniref:Secreted protein n=1 Tax=Oryza barthii TaxID=65489 RepID=A0A0D3G7M8_9ORYZ
GLLVVVLLLVVVVLAFSFDGLPPLPSLLCPPRPSLPSPTIVVTISLFIRLLRSSSSGVRAPFLLLLQATANFEVPFLIVKERWH